MEWGIPILTQKGEAAIKNMPPDLTARCRNILIQVDGKRSVEEIFATLKGLEGLDESFNKLVAGRYIQISRECKDLIKALAQQMLGSKSPTLIKKIDEMHAKFGDACWDHLDELDKTARLFYGEVTAENLKKEIARILQELRKS